VKVKFHWDRESKGDDASSCWIRVSSAWAGQGFGGVQIPRVGDEVVVDFINGDPDRPIITGRVYNESSMPPWELPAAATVMGFMSRSKDGNRDNANHLLFEDKAGAEKVDLHAEKDMHITVENNKTVGIDGSRTTTIKGEQKDAITGASTFHYKDVRTTTVEKAETTTFNNGQTETITNGRTLDITSGGDTVTIKGERNTTVDGTEVHHVTGRLTENYDSGQDTTIKAGGRTDTVKGDVVFTITGGFYEQNVSGKVDVISGADIKIKSTTKITLDAPHIEQIDSNKTKWSDKVTDFVVDHATFKIVSFSAYGASASVNAASVSWATMSFSTALTSVVTAPMNYTRSLTKIENSLQNVALSALHMFI